MDFNPSGAVTDDTFGITVAAGATLTLDLQWAEPWFGVQTDLDAYLLDSGGNPIAAAATDNVGQTQRPVEILQWENTASTSQEVQLAINRCSGTCNPAASAVNAPRLKFALLEDGAGVTKTEYPVSSGGDVVGPTIFGHTGTSGAISVAAVRYNNGSQPERYSSRGPVTHYFGPVSGTTPAAALGSPETIAKPDIAATDCGATTFFAFFAAAEATWRFCGTSAAAPHAAGVAALELQAKPTATVAQVRDAQTSTASPIGSFGSSAVGAGLLNADAAIASLLPPVIVTLTGQPASRTADSTPTFSFEANQPATFACAIDGGTAQPCASPYTVPSALADGAHKFEVDALNGSSVIGTASYSFTVDTTPPAIVFTKEPAAVSTETTPAFAFKASEPAAFTCSVDGAASHPCISPYTVPSPLSQGPHTFEVTASDQVDNSSHATASFTVDTVAPTVAITTGPPGKTNNPRPTFGFSADEAATFSCSFDGGPAQWCASPFTAPIPLADGMHTFEVAATDLAGNVGRGTSSFTVDTRPPRTFIAAHPPSLVRTRAAKVRESFRFGSNEADVTFVCKVDGGLLRFCGPRISRRFDAGKHTVKVRARDAAGNVDHSPAVFHFRVKRVG